MARAKGASHGIVTLYQTGEDEDHESKKLPGCAYNNKELSWSIVK